MYPQPLNKNELELLQGRRVFQKENLRFVYADVLEGTLPERYFDVIVLAASVQYFPDLKQLIAVLRTLLKPKGSIHILDSHFYPDEKARIAAQQRTLAYYQQTGKPDMALFYHHHLWEEARTLGGKNLNERADISLHSDLASSDRFLGWFLMLRVEGLIVEGSSINLQ